MQNILLSFLLISIFFSPVYAKEKNNLTFTEVESMWLKEHPIIRVANETDWPPFDFVEYGKPKGFAIDYISLLAKKIGIKIDYVNGYSWAELLELFNQKKIDVMPSLYRNPKREKYTLYTKPYYRGKLGIFINTDSDSIVSKKNLSRKKVAMQKSNGSITIVQQQFPKLDLIKLSNNIELVQSLATKKVDAIIGNPIMFYYHGKEEQIHNIKLLDYINMGQSQQLNTSLHIGIRKDWSIFHQIITKTMDSISDDEFTKIEKKWTSINVVDPIDWKFINQIIGLIIATFLFLLWNNKKLKRMVELKTIELKKLNKNLEFKVKSRTDDLLKLNLELKELAHTDSLTGAYNRRYFFDHAKHTVELIKREKTTLSIAMIDIDKFKNINDTYGHDIGDQIIQSLVQEISNSLRASDIFARWGGEEFLILFPHTTLQGALILTEKIRKTVENCSNAKDIKFTVSIGVSEFNENEVDIENIIKRADIALYKAKNNGRNRVEYS